MGKWVGVLSCHCDRMGNKMFKPAVRADREGETRMEREKQIYRQGRNHKVYRGMLVPSLREF